MANAAALIKADPTPSSTLKLDASSSSKRSQLIFFVMVRWPGLSIQNKRGQFLSVGAQLAYASRRVIALLSVQFKP
jgi:hypothetical protein